MLVFTQKFPFQTVWPQENSRTLPGLQNFSKIPGFSRTLFKFQGFPGLVGTMRGWKGRKDGRVVRWEGGRFLILFKGGGCRVSPIFHLFVFNFKGYLCYKMITSKNVPSEAQVKNFFISQKSYVPFSKYLSHLNHPMIYQICDVMMSIST